MPSRPGWLYSGRFFRRKYENNYPENYRKYPWLCWDNRSTNVSNRRHSVDRRSRKSRKPTKRAETNYLDHPRPNPHYPSLFNHQKHH